MNVLVLDGSGSMGINLLRLFDNRGDKVAVTLRKNREAKYIYITYLFENARVADFLTLF